MSSNGAFPTSFPHFRIGKEKSRNLEGFFVLTCDAIGLYFFSKYPASLVNLSFERLENGLDLLIVLQHGVGLSILES